MNKLFLLLFVLIAAGMDLQTDKIDNRWILAGLMLGTLLRVYQYGWMGFMTALVGVLSPLLFLGCFFVFRMIGAGDIKLFCVLGAFMGGDRILWGIFYAMLVGSGVSFLIMMTNGMIQERLSYFRQYILELYRTHKITPYRKGGTERPENFHFSIPILCSVLLYLGGIY